MSNLLKNFKFFRSNLSYENDLKILTFSPSSDDINEFHILNILNQEKDYGSTGMAPKYGKNTLLNFGLFFSNQIYI